MSPSPRRGSGPGRTRGLAAPVAVGLAVLAAGTLAAGLPWPRAAAAGLVCAVLAGLARRLPAAADPGDADPAPVPHSTGYHPAALLADALSRAAAEPGGGRRVRPRLVRLLDDCLELRGLDRTAAERSGLVSPQTLAWLDPPPGIVPDTSPARLRAVVAEVCALAGPLDERHAGPSSRRGNR